MCTWKKGQEVTAINVIPADDCDLDKNLCDFLVLHGPDPFHND